MNQSPIVLGYYPLRGKAQVCRLLCEYLHIPYQDLFFTPLTWEAYKKTQATSKWTFVEVPFIKHNDFIVTQTYPICLYLISQADRKDLLGRSIEDEAKIDMFLCQCHTNNQLMSFFVNMKDKDQCEKMKALEKLWTTCIQPKLAFYEENCNQNFYLGYISLIDFFIYEMIFLARGIFPKVDKFKKLGVVFQELGRIEEIKGYQESGRAVKNCCPVAFCTQWKQKCCGD